ncbi:MAG: hypothetical protein A3H35_13385 [Betaproteobacteria bacterium RIFCSPLOWO2_02_FULL_62_17]|nr:MAG: hypothetical protein A3H35_13385 [Betaproteobacteria bacterium RIFCSPLOWO2_02_FULL_62_17]
MLAAALALPGVLPARAETAPEYGMIGVRYLHYLDEQSGLRRITVNSPSLVFLAPIAGEWSLEGGLTTDNVSGASPRYHTLVAGASKMNDRRRAGDLRLTRYLPWGTLAVGAAYSVEHDYGSKALSVQASVSTEDKNTTLHFGLGGANDTINPVNTVVVNEKKRTTDLLLGVTRVVTRKDIVQFNLTQSAGHGYYTDPYKTFDTRPRERIHNAVSGKWNHHFSGSGGTSRLSYRFSSDSFKTRAHTFSEEYVQPLPEGWTLTPSLRYYSQSAANFYVDAVYDPVLGPPFLAGIRPGSRQYISMDQRLSAFGAVTYGIKIARQFGPDWSAEVKLDRYEQRGSWAMFGNGSKGLDNLTANFVQIGLYRRW